MHHTLSDACEVPTVSWHMQALHTSLSKLRLKMTHQEKENGGKAEDILVSHTFSLTT